MIPDFGHMLNLPVLEMHDVAIIRTSTFSRWIQSSRVLRPRMRPLEDSTRTDRVPLLVLTKAEQLVVGVRHHLMDGHYKLCIILYGSYSLQGLVLAGESAILVAVLTAGRPTLALLAGLEEKSSCCEIILHVC